MADHYYVVLVTIVTFLVVTADDRPLDFYVAEESDPETPVGNIINRLGLADKYTPSKLEQLRFKFLTRPTDRDFFEIGPLSSQIRTKVRIDRDAVCPKQERCVADYDVAIMPNPIQIVKVKIEITDINDNRPTFPQRRISHQISESAISGTSFVIPAANDPDSEEYGIAKYILSPDSRKFTLQERNTADGATDLRLVLNGKLDREKNDHYELRVIAVDRGSPPQSGTILLDVNVIDANDNEPKFTNDTYEVTVRENTPVGTNIIQVTARDVDDGLNGQVEYSFAENTEREYGQLFGIHTDDGDIFLRADIDYEEGSIYLLSVTARDRGPDSLPASCNVVVHVSDVNDNAPEISINTMTPDGTAQVAENAPEESFVAHVSVSDADSGKNGEFTCSIDTELFQFVKLSQTHFKLVTSTRFDREEKSEYGVTLTCRDLGRAPRVTAVQIMVAIQDVNDHTPRFNRESYSGTVQENNMINMALLSVSAVDEDWGPNGDVTYSLDEEARQYLKIDPYTGLISARIIFDHEVIQDLHFLVTARDGGDPSRSKTVSARLTILDLDDERPMFEKDNYEFGIRENMPANTMVGNVTAVDRDSPPWNNFTYHLHPDSEEALKQFKINITTGQLYTKSSIDRERTPLFYLIVIAKPADYPDFTSTATVTVHVADENDNRPVFTFPNQANNTVLVSSQAPEGYVISRIRAYDLDAGPNGKLSYFFTGGNKGETFSIDSSNGAIAVNTDLSLITREEFELSLLVHDNGKPEYTETGKLRITIRGDLPFYYNERTGSLLSEENLTIVLIFALATVCVAIVIIIAIVVIVRKKTRNVVQKDGREKQLMLCADEGNVIANGGHKMTAVPNTYSSLHEDLSRTKQKGAVSPDHSQKSNGYLTMDIRHEGLSKQEGGVHGSLSPHGWISQGVVDPRQTPGSVHSGTSVDALLRPSSRDGGSPMDKQPSPSAAKPVVAFIRDQAETEPTESDSANSGLSNSDSGRGHSSEEDGPHRGQYLRGLLHNHPRHSPNENDDGLQGLLTGAKSDPRRCMKSPTMRAAHDHREMLMRELAADPRRSPKVERSPHVDCRSLDRKRMPSSNLHVRFANNRPQGNGDYKTLPGERLVTGLPAHGPSEYDLHTNRLSGTSGDYYMYDSVDSAV